MRTKLVAFVMLAMIPVIYPTTTFAATEQQRAAPIDAEKQAEAFFTLLQANKSEEAVTNILSSSALWRNRTGVKEQMLAQMDAANKIYGPISAHERISTEWLGTMLIRQYYLVQHKDMITRWEFEFTRTSDGWKIGYFGFADDIRTWF